MGDEMRDCAVGDPDSKTLSTYALQCTPKSSIFSSGMVWYSLGPSSGGLYPCQVRFREKQESE